MNLKSGFEQDNAGSTIWIFWGVTAATCGIGAIMIILMFLYFYRVGIIGGRVM